MGMDVYGINPKLKGDKPEIDWENDPSEQERERYWEQDAKWHEENPGYYFRNNIWHWRPLWDFINVCCSHILTEEEWEKGHFNDGLEIDELKTKKIVDMLESLVGADFLLDQFYTNWKEGNTSGEEYPFTKENVEEFIAFAKESGGFKIC